MASRRRPAAGKKAPGSPRVVAITGAQCTIGRGLARRLASEPSIERVVAIDLRPAEALLPGVHFHRVDLARPSAEQALADIFQVEEVDTLVHLAHFGAPIPDAAYGHEVEVIGTLHALTAATAAKLRRLVVRSTSLVYGAHSKNPSLLREEDRLRGSPSSQFVNDKVEAERLAREFADAHPEVKVSILRFAPILGPEVDNLFQRYLLGGLRLRGILGAAGGAGAGRNGAGGGNTAEGRSAPALSPTIAGFDPLFQAIHEEDAVAALDLAVRADRGGIYNVAGRGVIPISTALERVGTLPVPLPYGMAARVLRAMRRMGLGLALPAAMLDYLRYPFVTDCSRFERELGFAPRHTTLDAVRSLRSQAPAQIEAAAKER